MGGTQYHTTFARELKEKKLRAGNKERVEEGEI
jgi:hypothetical protein